MSMYKEIIENHFNQIEAELPTITKDNRKDYIGKGGRFDKAIRNFARLTAEERTELGARANALMEKIKAI